ncbi:MAG: DNA recombination protein RmuC [Gammaproteobacteria bacterium]|nr:DNA recombination protein RmuC [Gammaproteobacteria bacterium]
MTQLIAITIAFLLGALIAGLITAVVFLRRGNEASGEIERLRARLLSQEELDAERRETLGAAIKDLHLAFDELAGKSLSSNSDTFLRLAREHLGQFQNDARADLTARKQAIDSMVKPISDTLEATRKQLEQTERDRERAFGAIDQHLHAMRAAHETLQLETNRLVGALQRPDVSGQWGEITLRRIVELAGMVEHCDFIEQPQIEGEEGRIRPDMIINLPDRGQLILDSKTPLNAYLDAAQAGDDESRKQALQKHATNMRQRVRELSAKQYWAQFDNTPDFVLMFVPGDQFLAAALSSDSALLDDAMKMRVMPVTPTSLVPLLKAVAYGWRHAALNDNAERIRDLAEELYKRLATFTNHLAGVGASLERSVISYNRAVGSLDRSVLPGARKIAELGITEKKPLATTDPVEVTPRTPLNEDSAKVTAEDAEPGNAPESPAITPAQDPQTSMTLNGPDRDDER